MAHAEAQAVPDMQADNAGLELITVEVVWSDGPRQLQRCRLTLPTGSTVGHALSQAAERTGLPWLAVQDPSRSCSVWDRSVSRVEPLKDGDRVACLRGLQVDPKEARRRRHAVQRSAQTRASTSRRQVKPVR